MRVMLQCRMADGTEWPIILESVESVTLVRGGVSVKCFGNDSVLHVGVFAIHILSVR